ECMWNRLPTTPDVFLCPSDLDLEWARDHHPNVEAVRLNVPVSVEWRLRTKVETFVHNAGWGGLNGRNGTEDLLKALKHVEKPIRLILRSQRPIDGLGGEPKIFVLGNSTVDCRIGTFPS